MKEARPHHKRCWGTILIKQLSLAVVNIPGTKASGLVGQKKKNRRKGAGKRAVLYQIKVQGSDSLGEKLNRKRKDEI